MVTTVGHARYYTSPLAELMHNNRQLPSLGRAVGKTLKESWTAEINTCKGSI